MDPTDILALVLMAIFSVRRSEAKLTESRAFPEVPPAAFEAWKSLVLRSRGLVAHSSLAKVVLNTGWYFLFRDRVPPSVLATVGLLLFLAWAAALVAAVWLGFRAARLASRLGIVEGRRLVPVDKELPNDR